MGQIQPNKAEAKKKLCIKYNIHSSPFTFLTKWINDTRKRQAGLKTHIFKIVFRNKIIC